MTPTKQGSSRTRLALGVAAVLAVSGCQLLDVSNPDIVPPVDLNSAAALPTIRAGAIGELSLSSPTT